MQTTQDTGPERFTTVDQCRPLGGHVLNIEHLARLAVFEAMQPGATLKSFLKKKVLFGNFGDIALGEIRDLAHELLVSERATAPEGYLAQLRGDKLLGYTNEEEDTLIALLNAPNATSMSVAQTLGYIPPKPRAY